nr:HNH endonuclease family protein [Brachybacterium halotolerans]
MRAREAFRALFYAPNLQLKQSQKLRARRIFIAYVLISFAKSRQLLPAGQTGESWSIEHIKPQSLATEGHDDPIYSIGNLALLTEGLNGNLGNGDYRAKLPALEAGSVYFDLELMRWKADGILVPSREDISRRAELLADEALDRVWGI